MTAAWTWLVYMAGDNNLEGAGGADLNEMMEVGSSADLNVIVRFDTEEHGTSTYRVEKGSLTTLGTTPGINTGDPAELQRFIEWGRSSFPAKHVLLDLWNHGGGWKDLPQNYNWNALRATRPRFAGKVSDARRSLFRTTAKYLMEGDHSPRAVEIDTGAHDYLDNKELRHALADALPESDKIDVLGFDACLMNMIEIGYELRDTAVFMVGSEQVEPPNGWPYSAILARIADHPAISPAEVATAIVSDYGSYYRAPSAEREVDQQLGATQSALDLRHIELASQAVDELAHAILDDFNSASGALLLARNAAQAFDEPEYVDLGSLATEVGRRSSDRAIKAAVASIEHSVSPGPDSFVLANRTIGSPVERASGVSIYFPTPRTYATAYGDLAFSKERNWATLLARIFAA